jgi:hypothetical protein
MYKAAPTTVDNAVFPLSGKTEGLSEKLRATQNACSVTGVHEVASEI